MTPPEIETYFATLRDAESTFSKERSDEKIGYTAAADKFNNRAKEAWEELGKTTSNPFVAWLCTEPRILRQFKGQAETVLKNLPADLNDLDRLANRHEWCGDYDEMRDAAIQAGALKVEYRVQMRSPGGEWRPFRPLHMNGGTVNHKEIGTFLLKGIKNLQVEMANGDMLFLRLDPNAMTGIRRNRDA